MSIKRRERTAILNSLAAGVVPKVGLPHIQVGRKAELAALVSDLDTIQNDGSAIRFVVGRFGSGKTFFLNLVRTVAIEKGFVVLQADVTMDRRLYGSGYARSLYTELVQNMSTKARPEGSGMPGLVERFVVDTHNQLGNQDGFHELEVAVRKRLEPLLDMTHGVNLIRVLAKYVEGFGAQNTALMNCATRWLKGEYGTKTEARKDLEVRDIIEDSHLYDMVKLWAAFARLAGYEGLFVNLDEMVVLSERLNNSSARTKNYEVILQILNDCLQGRVEGLGFCFAGTEEFLSDRRRGLFSYEALATRLADNPFAQPGIVDTKGPVIRLASLSREDLFVLLDRIANVHASGHSQQRLIDHEGIAQYMTFCERRLGAEYFMTPRDAVKQFVDLLHVLEQNPEKDLDYFLNAQASTAPDSTGDAPSQPPDDKTDGLASFQL